MSLFEKLANMSVVNVIIVSVILIALKMIFFSLIPKEVREYKAEEIKKCKDAKQLKELKKEKLSYYTKSDKTFKELAEFCDSLAFAFLLVFLVIRPFVIQAYFIPSESMMPGLIVRDHLIANKFMYFFKEPEFGNVVIFKAPKEAYANSIDRKPYDPPSNKLQRFWDVISNGDTRPDFIKRVIGEPGDEVYIKKGYIEVGKDERVEMDLIRYRLKVFKKDNGFVRLHEDGVYVDGVKIDERDVKDALYIPNNVPIKIVPGQVVRNGEVLNEPYIAEDSMWDYPNDEHMSVPEECMKKSKGQYYVKIPEGKYLVMGDNRNNSSDARFWGLLDRESIKGQAMFIFFPFDRIKIIH